jgi:signal transduction histidine kinase
MMRGFGVIAGVWTSLAGRLALLLTLGMALVASVSLVIAQRAHRQELTRMRMEIVAATVLDLSQRLGSIHDRMDRLLAAGVLRDIRVAPPGTTIDRPSPQITRLLQARLGPTAQAVGQVMPHALCFSGSKLVGNLQLATGEDNIPDCWFIRFRDPRGEQHNLAIAMPHYLGNRQDLIDPLYLAIIVLMSASVATVVGLFAIKPLRQLVRATEAFSLQDEPALLPENGPREIRTAIATFNLMQKRVSEGHRQRTGMLAAISHDLQTPLTRLQLRLDDLADPDAQRRLGADLAIMQAIVREGLELARSAENDEPWSEVDIDSLLGSIAADAAELGAQVEIGKTCGVTMRTKVDAMTRCLTNLVENAVKYGGCARIDCHAVPGRLDIHIADEGPGLSAAELDHVFEPFVRGEQSRSRATGGTGLGLTIARAQAKLLGGEVILENRDGGGLLATVRINMR